MPDEKNLVTKFELEMHRYKKGDSTKTKFELDQLRGVTPGKPNTEKPIEQRDKTFVTRMQKYQTGHAELPDARVIEKW